MIWYAWAMIALILISAGVTLGTIDQPRDPITWGTALWIVTFNLAFVVGIVALAEGV